MRSESETAPVNGGCRRKSPDSRNCSASHRPCHWLVHSVDDHHMDTIARAIKFRSKLALCGPTFTVTYAELLRRALVLTGRAEWGGPPGPANAAASGPHDTSPGRSRSSPCTSSSRIVGGGDRAAILAHAGPDFVAFLWATWLCGGVAVPVSPRHPLRELEYVVRDSGCSTVLCSSHLKVVAEKLASRTGVTVHEPPEDGECGALHNRGVDTSGTMVRQGDPPGLDASEARRAVDEALADISSDDDCPAVMLYTSGTTGSPKGAVHTHASLHAQIAMLCTAWEWTQHDRMLHCLPLHHIHGLVNGLLCGLYSGAEIEMHEVFRPRSVWERIAGGNISVFMGVPTMFRQLLEARSKLDVSEQERLAKGARTLRLAVSGSSACPVSTMESWKAMTGSYLLERFGMTETGMVLSNNYQGARHPGFVGGPLPGVAVTLRSPAQSADTRESAEADELLVKCPGMFQQYWGRPDATADAFTEDGWFRTGDAARAEETPDGGMRYQILGRLSADILKVLGHKVSALQVEDAIMEHPYVSEAVVFGVEDLNDARGELVVAMVVLRGENVALGVGQLRAFLADKLPVYCLPQMVEVVDHLPRNAMGKVNKKALKASWRTAGRSKSTPATSQVPPES